MSDARNDGKHYDEDQIMTTPDSKKAAPNGKGKFYIVIVGSRGETVEHFDTSEEFFTRYADLKNGAGEDGMSLHAFKGVYLQVDAHSSIQMQATTADGDIVASDMLEP